VPGWVSAPQAHNRVSNINFDIWKKKYGGAGLYKYSPTQALKSVKGTGNTLDFNPKWLRTLPSLIYFSWDMAKFLTT
jgi:hypothetical protein